MAGSNQAPSTMVLALDPTHEPGAIVLAIGGGIARSDVPILERYVQDVLGSSRAGLLVCDVKELIDEDAVAVDALARLHLTAQRLGRQVRLRDPSDRLLGLLDLAGLCDVMSPVE